MTYTPNPEWVDGVEGGTLITADALNHIEQGVVDAHPPVNVLPYQIQRRYNFFNIGSFTYSVGADGRIYMIPVMMFAATTFSHLEIELTATPASPVTFEIGTYRVDGSKVASATTSDISTAGTVLFDGPWAMEGSMLIGLKLMPTAASPITVRRGDNVFAPGFSVSGNVWDSFSGSGRSVTLTHPAEDPLPESILGLSANISSGGVPGVAARRAT